MRTRFYFSNIRSNNMRIPKGISAKSNRENYKTEPPNLLEGGGGRITSLNFKRITSLNFKNE